MLLPRLATLYRAHVASFTVGIDGELTGVWQRAPRHTITLFELYVLHPTPLYFFFFFFLAKLGMIRFVVWKKLRVIIMKLRFSCEKYSTVFGVVRQMTKFCNVKFRAIFFSEVVTWLNCLAARHLPRKKWFNQRPVHVGFVADNVALGVGFSEGTSLFICQYHSTRTTYSYFFHLKPTLYKPYNWQRVTTFSSDPISKQRR